MAEGAGAEEVGLELAGADEAGADEAGLELMTAEEAELEGFIEEAGVLLGGTEVSCCLETVTY